MCPSFPSLVFKQENFFAFLLLQNVSSENILAYNRVIIISFGLQGDELSSIVLP